MWQITKTEPALLQERLREHFCDKNGQKKNTNVTQSGCKYTKFLVVCQGGKAKIIFQLAIPGQIRQRFVFRGQINKVFLDNLSLRIVIFEVQFLKFS